jgi:hypothetical protein
MRKGKRGQQRSQRELPPCGLYRTGRALASDPEYLPAGALVMFHNHSNRNIPMVQLPKENTDNVWSFHEEGPGVENDDEFLEALEPLRPQGIYFLKRTLQTPDGTYDPYTLVQLGYNRDGEPILFPALRDPEENAFYFLEEGYGFEDLSILMDLVPEEPLTGVEEETSPLEKEGEYLH